LVVFTLAVDAVRDAWLLKSWLPMVSWQVFFSLGLFEFSLFVPKISKHIVERPAPAEAAARVGEVPGKPDSSA
jgi:hypothetical protein